MASNRRSWAYENAFCRNLGLISEEEQEKLHQTCVAIPGLGGVGGSHAQALARMGVGRFRLADMDEFEVVNFNRQLGADLRTVGRPKTEVTEEALAAVNPEVKMDLFPEGISRSTIDSFLEGVDVVVDGLEFFAIEARRLLFSECRRRGIPVITAGPVGYGAAVLVFTPDGMSFDEYFRIDDSMTNTEQLMAFGLGLAPGLGGGVDPSRVDFEKQKGPALMSSCLLCSGMAATEVLKLVCGRGKVCAAPRGVYVDPYRLRTRRLRPRPSLTRSLIGRLIRRVAFKRFPELKAMIEREAGSRTVAGNSIAGQEPGMPVPRKV